jgi:hypothetical protein
MSRMPRFTTHQVGRTTVYVDSHGDPFRFVREGVEVPCVCDSESGVTCRFDHSREMRLRAIPARDEEV